MSQKTSIIIIGAGVAGITVAQALDKKLHPQSASVTLITESNYLLHNPAILRTIVTAEGELERHIVLPYDHLFGKDKSAGIGRVGKVKIAKVTSVEETGQGGLVHLEGEESLRWDYLVIATGSEWNGPLRWPTNSENVPAYLESWRAKFAAAKSVVIAGAGAVGIELAGEILDYAPGTEVTMVHKGHLFLNATYPDVFRRRAASELRARGVRIITDDSLQLSQSILDGTDPVTLGRRIKTMKGVKIPADLIVATGGRRRVNTGFLSSVNSPSAPGISGALNAGGFIEITKTLQVKGNSKVFAAGDVVALPEQHTLMKAAAHAETIAKNIIALVNVEEDKPVGKLTEYVKPTDTMLLTNGRTRGSMYFDFFTFFGRPIVFGDWLSSTIKSKGLLIGIGKKLVNQ